MARPAPAVWPLAHDLHALEALEQKRGWSSGCSPACKKSRSSSSSWRSSLWIAPAARSILMARAQPKKGAAIHRQVPRGLDDQGASGRRVCSVRLEAGAFPRPARRWTGGGRELCSKPSVPHPRRAARWSWTLPPTRGDETRPLALTLGLRARRATQSAAARPVGIRQCALL
jgi:hypothetical protein